MDKLDLHGNKHLEVEQMVEDWIINQYNDGKMPCQIITGNSEEMKRIVEEVLDRNDFKYQVGDFSGWNTGYIQVNG